MLLLGLGLAAASAVASQIGFLFRERGATAAPDVDARHPLRTVASLFRQRWWTIGYLIAIAAYVLHVGALNFVDLSAVQAVLAGGLVILAVVAERYFGFSIERKQWIGVSLAAGGLALLALTGEVRSGDKTSGVRADRDDRLRVGDGGGGHRAHPHPSRGSVSQPARRAARRGRGAAFHDDPRGGEGARR